jgi:hypothetical protein
MNERSITVSVTDTPCECGYLAEVSAQPGSPIKFNDALREYYFEQRYSSGSIGTWVIRHCPMCGGVASRSLRQQRSVEVPEAEVKRLQAALSGVITVHDVERVLGKPDLDETIRPPSELVITQPGSEDPQEDSIRVLTYTRLSRLADVQLMAFSNGRVESTISPKLRDDVE